MISTVILLKVLCLLALVVMAYVVIQWLLVTKGEREMSTRLVYLTIVVLLGLGLLVVFSMPYMIWYLDAKLVIPLNK